MLDCLHSVHTAQDVNSVNISINVFLNKEKWLNEKVTCEQPAGCDDGGPQQGRGRGPQSTEFRVLVGCLVFLNEELWS